MRKINQLTKREHEVFVLMCAKLSNEEIAQKLALNKKAISIYISNIYDKLNISSREEAKEINSE